MATPTVLVVDDDPTIVDLVTQALQEEGYHVVNATGAQAPAVARARQPAVILLDLNMPGIDGIALSRTLRTDPRTMTIPIVVMTAAFNAEAAAARVLADDLLTKPFDLEDLYATVSAWTAPQPPSTKRS